MDNTMRALFSPDKSFHLERFDEHDIDDFPGEIYAFMLLRNEIAALPFLFTYYRNMGVKRFFMIDDHSEDGTREYLLAQPDAHVFTPSNPFGQANSGNNWLNLLLDRFGTGHWTLVVDADELLIYPHCEKIKLPDLCAYMDREGGTALFAFLLDMYPDGDLSKAVCVPDRPFYDICSFFDSDYAFRRIPPIIQDGATLFPSERVVGGPRLRKFYAWQRRSDFFSKALFKIAVTIFQNIRFWKGDKPHYAPALIKAPLVKWRAGCKRVSSHIVAEDLPGKTLAVSGALLHFKFFAGFHNKAMREVSRGQHYGGGQEYRRYLAYIKKHQDISFMYVGSRRYINSDTVLAEGLIRSTNDLDAMARDIV
jgi:glycosyltransferase involved in cell wall biosynthesis